MPTLSLLDGDLLELGLAAHEVRERHNDPAVATYNIDRNINYTNVCVYKCRFCAFYRPPGRRRGIPPAARGDREKIEETLALNGTGILMQGGVHPDLPIVVLRGPAALHPANLSRAATCTPSRRRRSSSSRARSGMSFHDVIGRLKAAGLMSIPGGGAELLSIATRKEILAYAKTSAEEWIDIMRQAHRHGLRTSATMMFGIGEGLEPRVEHLAADPRPAGRDRRLHRLHLVDLPARAHRHARRARDLRRTNTCKTLAVSRLFLDNVPHFQTSWVTQGKKIGQLALAFGADDMGSIMIEENVVSAAGTPYTMTQDEMEHLISRRRLHAEAAHQPLRAPGHPGRHRARGAQVPPRADPEHRELASPLPVIG